MKTLVLSTLALATMASGLAAAPMTDRVTSEELSARRQAPSPLAQIAPSEGAGAQITRSGNESIIAQSMILSDGRNWTLVPKGAVLHLPEAHQARVGVRPVGNLLPWHDFLALNSAWINAEEITLRQAEGVHPLDERRIAFWPKQSKMIVAVHQGGPISVTAPAAETATASTR